MQHESTDVIAFGGHLHHHGRFYVSAAVGAAVYLFMRAFHGSHAYAAAADAFFVSYLTGAAAFLRKSSVEHLKRRAAREDEGILLVVAIFLVVLAFNVVGVFRALQETKQIDVLSLGLVLAAVPLGWFMLHTISAFHYANLHYFDPPGAGEPGKALKFPATKEPDIWDFIYFAFVVGMTFQVSDVQICTPDMRRAVLGHSVVSFAFATVLIAMAVNVAVAKAG